VCAGSMSFQGGLMDQMEAAQREFLDALRRWNADEKGDFKLLEICSDASSAWLRPSLSAGSPI
jgi:hypothetical protein